MTYKTAEEAYATRQRLWESRQQEVDRVDVVSDLERFMFGMLFPAPHRTLQEAPVLLLSSSQPLRPFRSLCRGRQTTVDETHTR